MQKIEFKHANAQDSSYGEFRDAVTEGKRGKCLNQKRKKRRKKNRR
tara:strand:- start:64443 stop:64580 length:138 start_codon:yes stop_codon:yes gene_type:complete